MNAVIYTDMDGTLLDHHTYSFDPAKDMLEYIKSEQIPLILTTSKTAKEVIFWQQKLGIVEPFICENGAAVFFPPKYKGFELDSYPLIDGFRVATLGKEYAFITKYLDTIKDKYSIKGFHDMSLSEIMELTDLDEKSAQMASKRDFTEPFVMKDEYLLELLGKEADIYGLKITQGGRFYHCIGAHQDKGKAVQIAHAIFRRNGYEAKSIVLGDGKNDESMLAVADFSVQIPNAQGDFVPMDVSTIRAKYPGPRGWADALEGLLNKQK